MWQGADRFSPGVDRRQLMDSCEHHIKSPGGGRGALGTTASLVTRRCVRAGEECGGRAVLGGPARRARQPWWLIKSTITAVISYLQVGFTEVRISYENYVRCSIWSEILDICIYLAST